MTTSDKLREIAEKYFPCVGTKNDREYRKMEQDALVSDLTALISEHYYPKEFVLWLVIQDYWGMDILTCKWTNDEPTAFQEEKTTDELFEYWKENEQ